MADPTDSLVTYALTIQNLIAAAQTDLAISDIWYGEQTKIPRTPAVEVITGQKVRNPAGAPRRVENLFECFVLVQAGQVQDAQLNLRLAEQLAESIETILHTDPTLGGIVFNNTVVRIESGVSTRSKTEFRAARLTVQAKSLTLLPMQPNYNQ